MDRVILRHLKGSKASQLEEFPLQQFAELVFGRDPNSSVRFDPEKDDLVGRQHARIARDASDPYRFKVVDLNSRNGTFLNKLRVVGEMPIQPGDVIQLGAGGPEIQFDLDPLPAQYVKATRLGVAGPAGATALGVNETRVSGSPGAASGPISATGGSAPPPNAIGKATVERMIGDTKRQSNRKLTTGAGVAAIALAGLIGWQQYSKRQEDEESRRRERELAGSIASVNAGAGKTADSLRNKLSRAADLSEKSLPAEIMAKYASSTVLVDFSWNLIYAPTGAQVYHRYLTNSVKIGNRTVPIMPGGPARIPGYVNVGDNELEPALTITQDAGEPIGVTGSGSGFVVASNGFILTNRHVAANWRAPFRFSPDDVGVLLDNQGRIMLDANNKPILVDPPSRWIPSESKQTGPKRELDVFRGRQEYLYVRFRKNLTPVDASTARVSDRHDVALIKIDVPSSIEPVVLHDSYATIAGGEQVTVMGYPGVSDNIVAVLKSKDTFNREAQIRTVPDPTISVGNVGKVLRAADGPANDVYSTYAPYGDRYQLTINSTGGGNSGGPMFDEYGRVVGIYFAGRSGDAQISFAVPIKFGLELMNVNPNTK
ncbi:MAG: trypsin-like peptidase domain-containing protein [Gemmatimonadaceae bacterium]